MWCGEEIDDDVVDRLGEGSDNVQGVRYQDWKDCIS